MGRWPEGPGGVTSNPYDAHDPSVGVRRRHLFTLRVGRKAQFSGTLPMRSTATLSLSASRSRKVLNCGASR
jgi:hypothetical protein